MNPQENLKALLDVVSTKKTVQDFTNAFKVAVETLAKMRGAVGAELNQLKLTFDRAIADLKAANAKDLASVQGQLMAKIESALKEQEAGMNFIRDKVATLQDGERGEDGEDGQNALPPTKEELIALIKPLIPEPIKGEKGDPGTAGVNGRSTVGWGAHPLNLYDSSGTVIDKVTRHIKFTGATVSRSPDGIVTVAVSGAAGTAVYGEDASSLTLAHTPIAGTVRLYRGGAYQQAGVGKDYTISGATITLATSLQNGEVLLADYFY